MRAKATRSVSCSNSSGLAISTDTQPQELLKFDRVAEGTVAEAVACEMRTVLLSVDTGWAEFEAPPTHTIIDEIEILDQLSHLDLTPEDGTLRLLLFRSASRKRKKRRRRWTTSGLHGEIYEDKTAAESAQDGIIHEEELKANFTERIDIHT